MGYLVGYDRQNQYYIYNQTHYSVIVKRDIHFNEYVIGPSWLIPMVDNSFRGETVNKTLIFLSLPSGTEDSTKFTYANANPMLAPISNTHATPPLPQLANNHSSTMS